MSSFGINYAEHHINWGISPRFQHPNFAPTSLLTSLLRFHPGIPRAALPRNAYRTLYHLPANSTSTMVQPSPSPLLMRPSTPSDSNSHAHLLHINHHHRLGPESPHALLWLFGPHSAAQWEERRQLDPQLNLLHFDIQFSGKHYFKCQIFFGHCDPVPHLPFLNLASRSFEAFQVHSKFKLDRLVQLGVEYNGGLLTGSLTWSGESDTLKLHVLGAISSLQSALQTLDPRVAFKFHFNVQSSRTFVALTNLRSTSRAMKEGFDFELVQDRPSDSLSSPNGESICV
ncbi:hypothetical protein C8R43DRAFT_1127250 [Mycena crocata]|nr:hypothetical protein C8R43DRAFT_1127250 [Mycena crocata]